MANNIVRSFRSEHKPVLPPQTRRTAPLAVLFELYHEQGSFRFLASFALLGSIVLLAMGAGPSFHWLITSQPRPASSIAAPGVAADKRGAALAGATEGLTKQMLGAPRPDAYKLIPGVFATAPTEQKGKLLAAADAYSRKEPAANVLSKIDSLDAAEPNTAFMRGLGTLALGGRPNAEAGLALLRRAADARHGGAMALYGLAKINPPALIDKEPEEGRTWLQRAVDAGDGQAAYLLGHAYLSGWAGIVDPAKSVNLFRRAADAGHVDAMKVLGTLAMIGQGMPRDYAESETQFRRAAAHGDVEAQTALGMYLTTAVAGGWEHSFDEAVHWLTKAAQAGQAKAMNWLGMIHLEYAQGTPLHNVEKGLDWMRRCAALREKDCHYALGYAHETGMGVPVDHVRAAVHYQNAEGPKANEAYKRVMTGLSESEKGKVGVLQAELYRGDERTYSALGLKVRPMPPNPQIGSFSSMKAPHN